MFNFPLFSLIFSKIKCLKLLVVSTLVSGTFLIYLSFEIPISNFFIFFIMIIRIRQTAWWYFAIYRKFDGIVKQYHILYHVFKVVVIFSLSHSIRGNRNHSIRYLQRNLQPSWFNFLKISWNSRRTAKILCVSVKVIYFSLNDLTIRKINEICLSLKIFKKECICTSIANYYTKTFKFLVLTLNICKYFLDIL